MNEPAGRSVGRPAGDQVVMWASLSRPCAKRQGPALRARSEGFVAAFNCVKSETCLNNNQRYQFCSHRIENSLKYQTAFDD
jgi:hypothetical protein